MDHLSARVKRDRRWLNCFSQISAANPLNLESHPADSVPMAALDTRPSRPVSRKFGLHFHAFPNDVRFAVTEEQSLVSNDSLAICRLPSRAVVGQRRGFSVSNPEASRIESRKKVPSGDGQSLVLRKLLPAGDSTVGNRI